MHNKCAIVFTIISMAVIQLLFKTAAVPVQTLTLYDVITAVI